MTRTVSNLWTPDARLRSPHGDLLSGRDGGRIAQSLLRLRAALRASIPPKTLGPSVLLATWNIRDFGRGRFGGRAPEALAYIAEILGSFDLVAVQEVNEDLTELDDVCWRLGPWWSRVYTDVTEGQPGNRERLAFLFDTRTVRFSGLAGEIVLPAKKKRPVLQWARTPFTCGFVVGREPIELCTVHIYWGESVAVTKARVREIETVASTLAKRAKKRAAPDAPHTILMGDFNIFNRRDATFAALEEAGFTIPPQLQAIPGSNVAKTKRHYDQIAFLEREGSLQAKAAGVFDFYEHVFRDPGGRPSLRPREARVPHVAHVPALRSPADVGPAPSRRHRSTPHPARRGAAAPCRPLT